MCVREREERATDKMLTCVMVGEGLSTLLGLRILIYLQSTVLLEKMYSLKEEPYL